MKLPTKASEGLLSARERKQDQHFTTTCAVCHKRGFFTHHATRLSVLHLHTNLCAKNVKANQTKTHLHPNWA